MIYEEIKHDLMGIIVEGIRSITTNDKISTSSAYNKIVYIIRTTEDILTQIYDLEQNKEQKIKEAQEQK